MRRLSLSVRLSVLATAVLCLLPACRAPGQLPESSYTEAHGMTATRDGHVFTAQIRTGRVQKFVRNGP